NEQLKKEMQAARPETPSSCKLTGRLEGGLVHLQVRFEFRTARPKTLMALGCRQAWPRAATLDGQLPRLLSPGDEGLVVAIDAPGAHRLDLELDMPLSTRGAKGGERGVELALPQAAITALEQFQLPA